MHFDDLLSYFKVARNKPDANGNWRVHCPTANHPNGDRHASLDIGRGYDNQAIFHCHSQQCDIDTILSAVGLQRGDLYERANQNINRRIKPLYILKKEIGLLATTIFQYSKGGGNLDTLHTHYEKISFYYIHVMDKPIERALLTLFSASKHFHTQTLASQKALSAKQLLKAWLAITRLTEEVKKNAEF